MYPDLFTEIAPNLFQGGTDDLDVVHEALTSNRLRTDMPFDSIVTMYGWARPADWKVQEFRYAFPDAEVDHIDFSRLRDAVEFGYKRWKSGDRVLVRCQAGLNRSGLVMALILIKDGMTPVEAIKTIRRFRGPHALCNSDYVEWLQSEAVRFINSSNSRAA